MSVDRRRYWSFLARRAGFLVLAVGLAFFALTSPGNAAPARAGIRAIGYGAATTGGSAPCHFADEASLRACLARGGGLAIADRAFSLDPRKHRLAVAANTTLDGEGKLEITPSLYGLDIRASNVIVRNVVFHGTGRRKSILPQYPDANCSTPTRPEQVFGCMVAIHVVGSARNIWIDHNTFTGCSDICISVWDNNDGTGHPSAITISNNIFRRSFFGIGVGVAGSAVRLPPPGHLTFYGNLFRDVFRRQPRISSGYQAHVFNNYYTGPQCHGLGPGLGQGLGFGPSVEASGEILLENNLADEGSCGAHIDNSQFLPAPGSGAAKGYGKIDAAGNLGFASDQGNSVRHRLPVMRADRDLLDFTPAYAYRLLPVNEVKAAVLERAGAKHAR
jgi:pectate lyase